jgi:hypothetical protein
VVDRIVDDFSKDDPNWEAWALFLHYLQENPSQNSKDQLYTFVEKNGLELTPGGELVFYKGVNKAEGKNADAGFEFQSTRSGPEADGVAVDGVPQSGFIGQSVGSEVTMPRSTVKDQPQVHCSTGLHCGTTKYIKDVMKAQHLVKVVVNPRDVVSVPTDYDAQKVRVCRYTVESQIS